MVSVKNGRYSVKTSDAEKLSAVLAGCFKSILNAGGLDNFDTVMSKLSTLKDFAADGGKIPAGFVGDIADPHDRIAYILTTRTTNAVDAVNAMKS